MIGVTFFGVFLPPVSYTVIRRLTAHRLEASKKAADSVLAPASSESGPAAAN
jgi:hypothetical protein